MNNTEYVRNPENEFSPLKACSPQVSQLFIRGEKPELVSDAYIGRRVGIIGTRNATPAGLNDARRIAQVVSQYGGVVVSGMALGVDGAAHRGAIDESGATIAVLGSGVDVIYPTRHAQLAQSIMKQGCIISEFDCGTSALAWHFPVRNRIIAALSDVLVVPEGTLKGGARITVDLALAMGKLVCALPGSRRNPASELCNSIIRDGAMCINDPADVIRELGYCGDDVGWTKSDQPNIQMLPALHKKIVQTLSSESLSTKDLSILLKVSESGLLADLGTLQRQGFVAHNRGKYVVL